MAQGQRRSKIGCTLYNVELFFGDFAKIIEILNSVIHLLSTFKVHKEIKVNQLIYFLSRILSQP